MNVSFYFYVFLFTRAELEPMKTTPLTLSAMTCSLLLSAPSFAAEQEETQPEVNLDNITHYRAANTPINYSFINLALGDSRIDGVDEHMKVVNVSGQRLLNERFIFKLGYQGQFLDHLNNGADLDYRNNRINAGLGARFGIFESTDLEIDSHLLYQWNDGALNQGIAQDDLGYQVGIAINQGIGDSFEASLGLHYGNEFDKKVSSVALSFTQYVTDLVGVGINASLTDNNNFNGNLTYVGVHLNLAFY